MKALHSILLEIRLKRERVALEAAHPIDEASQMVRYLTELLVATRERIVRQGFADRQEEMEFFRMIKPQILGQLIYYNKVFRIETACPVKEGRMYQKFFTDQLQELKQEFKGYVCGSNFYRYYRSGRRDRDEEYFTRGRINYNDGLKSFVFEMDLEFSTYYDSKIARIIANDLIYGYLTTKISTDEACGQIVASDSSKEIFWTDSKTALIELVYALHATGVISHGKIGIRKIALVFQILFRVPLGDIHHSFHRMKDRSGTRTSFIDHLKLSLEQYMDKGL